MSAEKCIEIQRQIRNNTQQLHNYMTDLQNWEAEMKRKEAALSGLSEQELPPVRSKIKKERPVQVKKKPEKRIASYDYQAWDKFDVDKACEQVDMEEVGPPSLDSKKSQKAKQEKLQEEAQYEKQRGNNFVKHEKWDDAIKCYTRAIELVKDDAIFYANRALCHLKKDNLHQAEKDCTEALHLDPTYVKALVRRATARERLGSLRAASKDLSEALKLEPHNAAAKQQLISVTARMGTKGSKSKSSPSSTPLSTPTAESKSVTKTERPKIVELSETKTETEPEKPKEPSPLEKWKNGLGQNITVIKPVKKPPHLRSKRPLKPVPIYEIPLGKTKPEKPAPLKIIEIEDTQAQGDTNNNDSNKIDEIVPEKKTNGEGDKLCPESEKLIKDSLVMEKHVPIEEMVAPVNSVQFMSEWKYLKGKGQARSDYLSIIDPAKISSIFENALESDILSDIIQLLAENPEKYREKTVTAYLKGLCSVKRFQALAMFLSSSDKQLLTKLLHHCKTVENCSEEDISDLKNKYEI